MKAPLPGKQTIQIEDSTLQYVTSGAGSPPIVLVNGAGGPISGWASVYPSLEKISTVIAYDRLGVGGSSKPLEPQTGDRVVLRLRALLDQIAIRPPFVLVGHSIGGLFVNLYARLHPDEVAGVVLLEAAAPQDVNLNREHSTALSRLLQRFLDMLPGTDPLGETEFVLDTIASITEAGSFPPVPLLVITGGKPQRFAPKGLSAARAEHQRDLVGLSPIGRQVIAARSGHFPQFSEAELVIDAVSEIFEALR